MEYQKIMNLLGKTINKTKVPRLTTKKWIAIFDQSNGSYDKKKTLDLKHHN